MLHKAGTPHDLLGRDRSLSFCSCHNKLLNFTRNKRVLENTITQKKNLFKPFDAIKFGFNKGHLNTEIFLDFNKVFNQLWYDGLLFKLT